MLLHTVVVMEEGMVEVVMEGTGEGEEVTEDMAAMEEGDMMDTEATADRAEVEVSQHLISQARPNQPQRGSLSVSRTRKEGSGDSR